MTKDVPNRVFLKDYTPPNFFVDNVFLQIDLNSEEEVIVKSLMSMRRNPNAVNPKASLCLDGEEMTLQGVWLGGHPLEKDAYMVTDYSLTVLEVPDVFTLETTVLINPKKNTALSGLYCSRSNFCTQCEAHGFRRITYYLDRPDVMSRFTTSITADKTKYPILLSNGNLVEQKDLEGNRQMVRWKDPSLKPAYLFALVAGDFDVLEGDFQTMSGRTVDLKFYLEKGFGHQGHYALTALKNSMRWDEENYGREYDLDIYLVVAVSDFNMGAMENKGLNIFNTKYVLATPETATDDDYIAIENVIGHEYFHNWTGNRITCRDWFQITLKEGLTVFRDQTFMEDQTSPVARIDEVNHLRLHQFPEDGGPTAHPIRPDSYIEVNNFYTNTVYRKGSEVIRMIRTLIGKEAFRKGMDLYFERHDGQAVTTEEFVQALQDASHKDLTQFKRWYTQAGTPVLHVKGLYDDNAKTYTLQVAQSCPATPGQPIKEPFHMPLKMGLIGEGCVELPLQLSGEKHTHETSRVLEIKDEKQSFTFVNIDKKPVPSLLRDFSAPVKLEYDYTDEDLLWLLKCDRNVFSRWEAGQQYCVRLILNAGQSPQSVNVDALASVFGEMIDHNKEDKRWIARLMTLPAENYLVEQMPVADFDVVHAGREAVKQQLAHSLLRQWEYLYDSNGSRSYVFNMTEMGKRNLKNLALNYLINTQNETFIQWAMRQFEQSDNMTDKLGALQALNQSDSEARNQALEQFYQWGKDYPLVVNKWLTLQAVTDFSDTVQRVQKLLKHPAFDIRNPNNVYALLVAFGQNGVCFHASSGEGYQLMAEQILRIDPENPQVAARLVTPLTQWRRFNQKRQDLLKVELERIVRAPKLSRDVYELVTKSLEA